MINKPFDVDVLIVGAGPNGLGLYTDGCDHRWGSLSEGARKKLNHLSFAVFEEDFEPMKKHIEGQRVKLLNPLLVMMVLVSG